MVRQLKDRVLKPGAQFQMAEGATTFKIENLKGAYQQRELGNSIHTIPVPLGGVLWGRNPEADIGG